METNQMVTPTDPEVWMEISTDACARCSMLLTVLEYILTPSLLHLLLDVVRYDLPTGIQYQYDYIFKVIFTPFERIVLTTIHIILG